jgi:hypothetical protein
MDRIKYICFLGLAFLHACAHDEIATIHTLIGETQARYAPDRRTAIFDIHVMGEQPVLIFGETNVGEAKNELLKKLDQAGIEFQEQINILPDLSVGEQVHALINVSVANLRSVPRHSAELVTQALLGTPVLVLKVSGGWYLIQTPDKYIAWTDEGSLVPMDSLSFSDWKKRDKIICVSTYAFSTNAEGEKVSDLVAGDVLVLVNETEAKWNVKYPDGRIADIAKKDAILIHNWLDTLTITESSIIRAAKDLMGVPYLWGGTSTKGVDCSGFTKTVYFQNGIILPRDASQQVFAGELVDEVKNFSRLQVGDLLFFGKKNDDGTEKVVHVGLWLGNHQFIHASGDVHISSMDSLSENFDSYNYNRYLRTRRILGSETSLPAIIIGVY